MHSLCRAVSLAAAVVLLSPVSPISPVSPVSPVGAADPAEAAGPKPSPRWAEITRVADGLRFVASKHDSRLTVTRDGGRVVFHDRALQRFREALPAGCRRVAVTRGIAASCRVPAEASATEPFVLEIRPQGGNDRVDGGGLGAELRLRIEPGAGDDTVIGGAGDDLLNGALGIDTVSGGPGRDKISTGPGNDVADGGAGDDRVIGADGNDFLTGSVGLDTLEGGDGNDTLLGGAGEDSLLCGNGFDTTDDDGETDLVRHCEQVLP